MKKTIMVIIGTRPDTIKMAPVYRALSENTRFKTLLVSTGQHAELQSQALEAFGIQCDINLNLMKHGQSLAQLSAACLARLDETIRRYQPSVVLGHGDTTTCYAAAQAAFFNNTPFMHVEAGLRSFDLGSPFPEEFNRQAITQLASHHFATDQQTLKNLKREGVDGSSITVAGNTVVDAIKLMNLDVDEHNQRVAPQVLITLHRRQTDPLAQVRILAAVRRSAMHNSGVLFKFPLHPSPKTKRLVEGMLGQTHNVMLLEPLSYGEFLKQILKSRLVITDSGGVQEEASYFKKPVLVVRDATERQSGMASGLTELVGTHQKKIEAAILQKLRQPLASRGLSKDISSPSITIAGEVSRYLQ